MLIFLALIDYRVRIQKLVSEAWWVMYDSGHHEHDGDKAHAPIQKEWHKTLKYV